MVSCTGSKTPDEVDVDQESTGLGCWHFSFNPFFVGRPGAAQKPTKMLSRRCREKNDTIIPRLMREVAVLSAGENAIDLSTAENWLMRHDLIENVRSNGGWELPLAVGARGFGGQQSKLSMDAATFLPWRNWGLPPGQSVDGSPAQSLLQPIDNSRSLAHRLDCWSELRVGCTHRADMRSRG